MNVKVAEKNPRPARTLQKEIKVILLEDRLADARLVEHALDHYQGSTFSLTVFQRLAPALSQLASLEADVIIADLGLPDCTGLETFHQLHKAVPSIPVVIMTAQADSAVAVSAVDAGAQDYLVKGEIESQALGRLLLQAIARQRLRQGMAEHLRNVESSRTRLHNLIDLNLDGMLIVDHAGKVIFANRRAEEMFSITGQSLMNHPLGRPLADETGRHITIHGQNNRKLDVHMRTQATGSDADDTYMVLLSDLTGTASITNYSTGHTVDSVTGLFSREMFYEQAHICLQHARSNGLTPAMLCINLDNFRRINEAMGHGCGDELLRLTGTRIREQLRAGDIVGRFGSDEFLVLLAPLRRPLDADTVAAKIMQSLAQPVELWEKDLRITARTGVSIYPRDGGNVEDLVRHAQVAGQRAKDMSGAHVHHYTQELTERSERRFHLEQQLRRALPQQQFEIAYQPVIGVHSGKMVSVEALLRWHQDSDEQIGPAEFVPMLEETGLITGVGEWVLRQACEQIQAWRSQGYDLSLSVNISPVQFESPQLLATIESAISDSGLDANALVLELTESVLMRNVEASVITLKALRDKGVQVAIDDFGTGFSSLNYLKRFAIDTLKIDRSFIRDIMLGGHDAAITRATIDLAHNLGLRVIAEGVETSDQLCFLNQYGCDAYQGFYCSPAVAPSAILEMASASQTTAT